VGVLTITPSSRNTIPGNVMFTVDMRHPDTKVLEAMDAAMRKSCDEIAKAMKIAAKVDQIIYSPPVAFDPKLIESVRACAAKAGYSHMDMISGAGHDSCYMAKIVPTAMIFVPCEEGLSHNEEEAATPDDLAAGCNVLLRTMVQQAG